MADPDSHEPVTEPPWWTPRRPGRRRQPLSRDDIVEAAVRILDAEGVDALTVRRLGEELNTGSSTLYWHIANKDELGELVYDHVMGEIELPEPDPARWEDQLKDLARQAYRVMLRHRDLVRLSLGRIPAGPNMLRVMQWQVGLLRAAGLPDPAAAYAGDMLGRYLDASVLEVTSEGGPPPELVGQHFGSLSPEMYPDLLAIAGVMMAGSDDERFEFGLDLLVRGLAAHAPEPRGRLGGGDGATSRRLRGQRARRGR
jgi:AcrR family transcriptional regulator